MILTDQDERFFRTFGFLLLQDFFSLSDITELSSEFDEAMSSVRNLAPPARRARFFMDANTPNLAGLADGEGITGGVEKLLGRKVICIHIGGMYLRGNTQWHSDNYDLQYTGVKLVVYLDRLHASTGALRVIPGSHQRPMRNLNNLSHDTMSRFNVKPDRLPFFAIPSRPGDIIAFDHRLWHASFNGGALRRMIEINFYADPRTPSEVSAFIYQMQQNHAAASAAGVKIYNDKWCSTGSKRHLFWVERLRQLGVLYGK
ncbi:protein involved in biosynthesis of mitomycin antibiotics/polyketide fumonisin [Pseudomonas sp. GM79]|uniref:phytanoyl-CoA dioxygenase family protein n=1 Tax=Pseudomonas sp. GM79 TaxID=1144338 RepID=UPI00026F6A28|nr:phytanoyl-CoA dioxygenase family protein [Pseudomonas sp. GM79]EJN25881.1 protein involved in biosynthesis of mitomycin antibiotics/polyketide fumonisin [Pseudomonas sp. GM79]